MSTAVTPDNCRDMQEAEERNKEASARYFEQNKRRYDTITAERIAERTNKMREERLKRSGK